MSQNTRGLTTSHKKVAWAIRIVYGKTLKRPKSISPSMPMNLISVPRHTTSQKTSKGFAPIGKLQVIKICTYLSQIVLQWAKVSKS